MKAMSKAFDIGIESLAAGSQLAAIASPSPSATESAAIHFRASDLSTVAPNGKSFYIETFGCQMNAHDSEKVSGVLLERGYRAVDTIMQADLVLYNTCSIREKAAQKVFSRLGEMRSAAPRKVIGVLGCLAQQEGEEIFERAPWVSLVCGSASYRKLPELMAQLEEGGRRVSGLDLDTDETFETEITRRDNPIRAYITIIEGCDYACAYCVVPHTRGPERSRASDAVLAEARRLADAGYTEIQLLGQTVNSYRDPSPRGLNFTQLLREVAAVDGIRRVRFTTSHPNDFHREIVQAIDETPELCDHIHLPVQSGSTPHPARHAPHLHARRVSRENFLDSRRAPPVQHHVRHHRRLSRRDRKRFRGKHHAARRGRLRRHLFLQIFAAPQHIGRHHARRHLRSGAGKAPRDFAGTPAPDSDRSATKSSSAARSKCSSTAATNRAISGRDAPAATAW